MKTKSMKQTLQTQRDLLEKKMTVTSLESNVVNEELLKKEILNYLLDEESDFKV